LSAPTASSNLDNTDQAVAFIKRDRKDKPFALYVGHKAVHSPFQPAERHKDLFKEDPLPQRPDVQDRDNKGKPALTRKVADPPKARQQCPLRSGRHGQADAERKPRDFAFAPGLLQHILRDPTARQPEGQSAKQRQGK
jgi:hypothetical protein